MDQGAVGRIKGCKEHDKNRAFLTHFFSLYDSNLLFFFGICLKKTSRKSKTQLRSYSPLTAVKYISARAENYLYHDQPQGFIDIMPVIHSLLLPCSKTSPIQRKHHKEVEIREKRENSLFEWWLIRAIFVRSDSMEGTENAGERDQPFSFHQPKENKMKEEEWILLHTLN